MFRRNLYFRRKFLYYFVDFRNFFAVLLNEWIEWICWRSRQFFFFLINKILWLYNYSRKLSTIIEIIIFFDKHRLNLDNIGWKKRWAIYVIYKHNFLVINNSILTRFDYRHVKHRIYYMNFRRSSQFKLCLKLVSKRTSIIQLLKHYWIILKEFFTYCWRIRKARKFYIKELRQ